MESEQSQKHHWLPVMILNNHCDQEGKIWVNNGSKVYHTNPRKVFAERNLNAKWVWEVYGDESDEDSEKTSSSITVAHTVKVPESVSCNDTAWHGPGGAVSSLTIGWSA